MKLRFYIDSRATPFELTGSPSQCRRQLFRWKSLNPQYRYILHHERENGVDVMIAEFYRKRGERNVRE